MPVKVKLSPELEHAVLRAVAEGLVPFDSVDPAELSTEGKAVLQGISFLQKDKTPEGTPYPRVKLDSVLAAACDIAGGDRSDIKPYIKKLYAVTADRDIEKVLREVRDRQSVIEVMNLASEQLALGTLDLGALGLALQERKEEALGLEPIAAAVRRGIPDPPVGWALPSLPLITKASGGVMGVWVVGGEPGMGKSTLAYQISLEVARLSIPVLYHDLDGTGLEWLIERTRHIVGDDKDAFQKATENIFYRESIRHLSSDLRQLAPPALVVVDSIQTLPTKELYRRTSLDHWIVKLKQLVHQGYTVLLVSEKSRAEYGHASLKAFKESGEIEYAASFAAQLISSEDGDPRDAPVEFHIVKNRHRPDKGHIATLWRDDKKSFWFTEHADEWESLDD
jgi:hypothetical protein